MNYNAESVAKRAETILKAVKDESLANGDVTLRDVATWKWTGRVFAQMSINDAGMLVSRLWVELDMSDSFSYQAWFAWTRDDRGSQVDIVESLDDIA